MILFQLLLVFCVIFPYLRSTDEKTISFEDEKGNKVYLKLESVGCYADQKHRALRSMYYDGRALINWKDPFDTSEIIKRCAVNAYQQGFSDTFGIQYYGECWSDGMAEERYNKYGVSSNCEHGVGKDWANMVYRYQVVKTAPASST